MKSFEELFCESHGCSVAQFQRQVFWQCLTWRGKLLAPFLGGAGGKHFGPDRTFIAGAGRATDMAHIQTEIRDYFEDPLNRGWLRQVGDIRVSTRRVRNLARRYLPDFATSGGKMNSGSETTAPLAVESSRLR